MPRPLSKTEVGIPNNLIRKKLLDYQREIARARANAAATAESPPAVDDTVELSSSTTDAPIEAYSEKTPPAPRPDNELAGSSEAPSEWNVEEPPEALPTDDPNEGKTPEQIQAEYEASQRLLERRRRSPFVPKF